jgi:hypothetical protein
MARANLEASSIATQYATSSMIRILFPKKIGTNQFKTLFTMAWIGSALLIIRGSTKCSIKTMETLVLRLRLGRSLLD